MTGEPGPVFVQRRTYRRRRMADAARLLPILGAVLVLVPLLWSGDGQTPVRTVGVMFYLFLIWVLLAGISALISRHLSMDDSQDTRGAPGDEDR